MRMSSLARRLTPGVKSLILPPLGPKHHGRASSKTKAKRGHGVVREQPGRLKGSGAEPVVQNIEAMICPLLSIKPGCFVAGLANSLPTHPTPYSSRMGR